MPVEQLPPQPVVTWDKPGCRGTCSAYTLQIFASGDVVLQARRNVGKEGRFTRKLTTAQLDDIVGRLLAADFFALKPDYVPPHIADIPYGTVHFRVFDRTHTVKFADEPEPLVQLDRMLTQLANEPTGWQPLPKPQDTRPTKGKNGR
jgi:hypothetical protein